MVIFDTKSLLIFYLGKEGVDIVEDLLQKVQIGLEKGLLNVVNFTEFYYILYRKSPMIAEERANNLRAYGIEIVPATDARY